MRQSNLKKSCLKKISGFSLAELLITLLILGEIATFTIPKILSTQQNSRSNAAAKEMIASLSGAYQAYQLAGNSASTMRIGDLTPYLNYIKQNSTSQVDDVNNGGFWTCGSGTITCYQLHSGGVMYYWAQDGFCAGSPTALAYSFDPEVGYSGTTTGPQKGIRFYLYLNGRITTEGTLADNTLWNHTGSGTACSFGRSAIPANDPTWFSW